MGCVHACVGGTPDEIWRAITASMEVLEVTERTAAEAADVSFSSKFLPVAERSEATVQKVRSKTL